jgi:hypothetical protein
MKIKKLYYSRGASLNVGEYSNIKPEVGIEVEVEEGENIKEAWASLVKRVDSLWKKRVQDGINDIIHLRENNERDAVTREIMDELVTHYFADAKNKPVV